MKLAAIDVGSNAIRLVISEYGSDGIVVLKKLRVPIRIGADVFDSGWISQKVLKQSARAFVNFAQAIKKEKVAHIRAVATSALRDAQNSKSFIEFMRRKSGIKLEIISGLEEGRLIFKAVKREIPLEKKTALLIDIGGGSAEITATENGNLLDSQSFPMGTVRLLENLRKRKLQESAIDEIVKEQLSAADSFLAKIQSHKYNFAIGTGGNLETLGKLKSQFYPQTSVFNLKLKEIEAILKQIKRMSIEARIRELGLRPDRADVIVPALTLLVEILKRFKIEVFLIPYVGLKDGVVVELIEKGVYGVG